MDELLDGELLDELMDGELMAIVPAQRSKISRGTVDPRETKVPEVKKENFHTHTDAISRSEREHIVNRRAHT